MLRVMDVKLAN